MKVPSVIEEAEAVEAKESAGAELLRPLVAGAVTRGAESDAHAGVVIGELAGITGDGEIGLVLFAGQLGSAAVAARSVRYLQGAHIGASVVLVFEDGDPAKPIILGVLTAQGIRPRDQRAGHVEVIADEERVVVTAKKQIVLRCGKASITLTESGKVLIHGEYVSTRATGVNRLRGGSVQIN